MSYAPLGLIFSHSAPHPQLALWAIFLGRSAAVFLGRSVGIFLSRFAAVFLGRSVGIFLGRSAAYLAMAFRFSMGFGVATQIRPRHTITSLRIKGSCLAPLLPTFA